MGATGIRTHVPVAAVFQLVEYVQTVTTIARLEKIDLHFRDPEPEAEELLANRVVAHILRKQNDQWSEAKQQRDVQRLWMLWCEGAAAYLCERSQLVPGKIGKSAIRSWTGQTQRRRATAPKAHEGAKNIGLANCSNSQGKLRISSGSFTDTFIKLVAWVRFRGVQFTCGTKFHCGVPSCCKTHAGRL